LSDVSILGVAAYHHGSAAVMLRGGKIVAAAAEPAEGFDNFPHRAIRECLRQSALSPADVDFVAFAGKPRAEFARVLLQAPAWPAAFVKTLQPWLERRLHVVDALEHTLGRRYHGRCLFVENAGNALEAAFGSWQHVLSYPRDESAPPTVTQVERAEEARAINARALLFAAYPFVMATRAVAVIRRAATPRRPVGRSAVVDALSYFSQSTAGSTMGATAVLLAHVSRALTSDRGGNPASRPRVRQDDTVPDEIYTLW
jgi:hypothetical protein